VKVDVSSASGTKAGSADLPDELFGITPNSAVMHQVVTAQLAHRRAGTHPGVTVDLDEPRGESLTDTPAGVAFDVDVRTGAQTAAVVADAAMHPDLPGAGEGDREVVP